MSKPVNKTMIGFFVVGAIALIVVAIAVLGSGKFFQERFKYVMIFEGSVKGLNKGAPVVLRGVKIGAVSDIQMHFDYSTKAITILVYAEFEKGRVLTVNLYEEVAKTLGKETQYTVMRELVQRGLRAQLEMQSIVTGQLQITMDFYPDKAAVYKGIDKAVQEIPTIPTPLQELTRKLETIPFDEIFNKANSAIAGIDKLVQSPELKETVVNFNTALKDVQLLIRNVNDQVKPLSAAVSETVRDTQKLIRNADTQVSSLGPNLNGAIGDARKLIKNVDGTVDDVRVGVVDIVKAAAVAIKELEKVLEDIRATAKSDSFLMYRVTESLGEVEKAARSLRILTEYLERHPEALLSGKGDSGGK